jgi:hypothetical protein
MPHTSACPPPPTLPFVIWLPLLHLVRAADAAAATGMDTNVLLRSSLTKVQRPDSTTAGAEDGGALVVAAAEDGGTLVVAAAAAAAAAVGGGVAGVAWTDFSGRIAGTRLAAKRTHRHCDPACPASSPPHAPQPACLHDILIHLCTPAPTLTHMRSLIYLHRPTRSQLPASAAVDSMPAAAVMSGGRSEGTGWPRCVTR